MFQSSPTSQGGRYDEILGDALYHAVVSILAHLARWALRRDFRRCPVPCRRFNPRPPRKVGATSHHSRFCATLTGFNPRPPRKVGATIDPPICYPATQVSILAHLARWALLQSFRERLDFGLVSILAHLARWALPKTGGAEERKDNVSILAHLARWALRHVYTNWQMFIQVSILAHLARWALRMTALKIATPLSFQSSPTSQGGRYPLRRVIKHRCKLFQSSPTSQGGRYGLEETIS